MYTYFSLFCNFLSKRSLFRYIILPLIIVFIHVLEWSLPGLFIHGLHAHTSANINLSVSEYDNSGQNTSEVNHAKLPIIDWNDQLKLFDLPSTTQKLPGDVHTASVWLLISTIIVFGAIFWFWRSDIASNFIKYLSEFLGTFALIFVGAGCVCADYYLVKSGSQGFGLLGIAIAFGFVVVAIAYSLGYVSGAHINPAVTISMVVSKRMNAKTGFLYIVSQIGGASFGGFLLKMLFPAAMAINLGTCTIGPGISILQAVVMEAVITFLLVFVVYATVIDKRATPTLAGLAIGLVVLFGVMVGGTISGGSMNPARVFGPALASGHFENHYVWWIGPVAGGLLAGLAYETFFAVKEKNKQPFAEPTQIISS